MLLGRAQEQARIDALLEHARSGVSGSLIVRGEPGIGKSALLHYAIDRADGMTVLSATGIEAESELPYSGLSELLHPVLELMGGAPRPQSDALAAALALAPATDPDPFAVSAATLSLLALAAERLPVLAVIDDAQWLDRASRDAVLFAVRRLHADRALVLFGVRDGEGVDFPSSVVPEIVLRGIDPADSLEMIAKVHPSGITPTVAERITTSTLGNPLAILEAINLLTPAQLAGAEPLQEPLPTGPGIQQSFERRVARLPLSTQTALLLLAASESGSIEEIGRAASGSGIELAAFEGAEIAGLIRNDGLRIQFHHPLVRSAVYYGATPPARRAAHAALAAALDHPKALVARAWHLAAAAQGEDEGIAALLEQAAREARRRSGHVAAARAFERAARMTPDQENRARRLFEAGTEAYVAGESQHGIAVLEEALRLAEGIPLRADIMQSRARAEMWTGSPAAARKILLAAADLIEATDVTGAALMLVDAATTTTQEGDRENLDGLLAEALRVSERAYIVGRRAGGQAEAAGAGALGKALFGIGRHQEAHALLVQSLEAINEKESLQLAVQLINSAAGFLYYEEFDRMRPPLERLISEAQAASAPGALPYALGHLSELDFRTGRWVQAQAGATQAVALATELDHRFSLIYALACLSWIEAGRGLESECRSHVERMLTVSPHARTIAGGYAARISGLVHLAYGRHEDAIKSLQPLVQLLRQAELIIPALFQETPDLIEAYVHAGRRDDAEAALDFFQEQAEATAGTWPRAAAARCRGMAAEDFEPSFQRALELHANATMPFERARTELCYGERLRRAKRRSEAREQLHAALATFQRLGAEPWANRARNELRATGETVRREMPASDELTQQELQVALKVAEGATNKEAAAALFISPKTVEAHLSHIYGKLGLRSRTELAHRFASEGSPSLAPAQR